MPSDQDAVSAHQISKAGTISLRSRGELWQLQPSRSHRRLCLPAAHAQALRGEVVAPPLERAASRQHNTHAVPLARHAVTEGMKPVRFIHLVGVVVNEDDTGRAERHRGDALAYDANTNGAAGLVAAAGNDRRACG